MTQPAQSSGHEWTPFDGKKCCECGWGCRGSEDNDDCRRKHARHVASVAQAAQPQEVPAEQRVLTAEEIAYKATAHECGWAEYHINELVASKIAEALAQPASAAKPAEDGLEAQAKEVLALAWARFNEPLWKARADMAELLRTYQAARERELREKLLELAESTDDLLNTMLNSRTFAQRERVAKAVADARALLASHWPAQKESK